MANSLLSAVRGLGAAGTNQPRAAEKNAQILTRGSEVRGLVWSEFGGINRCLTATTTLIVPSSRPRGKGCLSRRNVCTQLIAGGISPHQIRNLSLPLLPAAL